MSKNSRVTIQDIAAAAGVGVGTVSRVLNNSPKVRAATRSHVQSVMAQLDYRPKSAARVLRTSRSNILGFVTDEIATTPYAGKIIQGAQDAAWEQGKILLVVNTSGNNDIEDSAINMMLERQVEGILYATMYHRPVTLPAHAREVPVVLLDCFVADQSLPSVVPDEVRGGYRATEHLLSAGHRRIGFINNENNVPAATGRLQGYRQALADAGIAFERELLIVAPANSRDGYLSTQCLMQLDSPPTALFCFNDQTTIGVYRALRDLKLSIPADVAVVGFDNAELIAPEMDPPLTTLELPHYEMGYWAVEHLLQNLLSREQPPAIVHSPTQHLIECPLIKRSSV